MEYQQRLAEHFFQFACREGRDQLAQFVWWTFRDFGNLKYKGINSKGLLTYAGCKKDVFYLLQSLLRPELPVLQIAGKEWFLRRGSPTNGIKVYSNLPKLRLRFNGQDMGEQANGRYVQPVTGRRIDNVFWWSGPLRPGRNDVEATDGQGHRDAAVIYYWGKDAPPPPTEPASLVGQLSSSNPDNPAIYIDRPVAAQSPFYYDFDGSADNTFDAIPDELAGAGWIATRRTSKPDCRTGLSFRVSAGGAPARGGAQVFVLAGDAPGTAESLKAHGFTDAKIAFQWRDNNLNLVPCRVYRLTAAPGQAVTVPKLDGDYLVLAKPPAGSH
jgi:beta-galactosidase